MQQDFGPPGVTDESRQVGVDVQRLWTGTRVGMSYPAGQLGDVCLAFARDPRGRDVSFGIRTERETFVRTRRIERAV